MRVVSPLPLSPTIKMASTHALTIPGSGCDIPTMTFIIPMDSSVVTVIEDFRPSFKNIVKYKPHGGVYYINLRDGSITDRRGDGLVAWRRPRDNVPREKMYTIPKSKLKSHIQSRLHDIIDELYKWLDDIKYEYENDRDVTRSEYVRETRMVDKKLDAVTDMLESFDI